MVSVTGARASCRVCQASVSRQPRRWAPSSPPMQQQQQHGGLSATASAYNAPQPVLRMAAAGNARRLRACAPRRPAAMAGASSEVPPMSREDAISQAVSALNTQVESAAGLRPGRRRGKGFAKGATAKNGRMIVEVPVADESAQSTVLLVKDIVEGVLEEGEVSELTVVFSDFEAAKAALKANFPKGVDVDYLEEVADEKIKGNVMIVQPGEDEADLVAELIGNWSGQVAILLNPGWNPFSPPPAHEALVGSFDTVYSFLPVAMKIFVSTVEGAVFKRSAEDPWQIFQLKGEQFMAIGRQNQRPSNDNLEVAFANAAAATGNPLSNLFGKKNKK